MQQEEVVQDEAFNQILQKVIVEVNGFFELKEYIGAKKPSFNFIQTSFSNIVDQGNNRANLEQNVQKILEELLRNNVQRLFIRVFFQYLKTNQEQMNLRQFQNSGIAKIWKELQVQELLDFIELFDLKNLITEKQLHQHFKDLLYKQKFDDAYLFYTCIKLPQECFNKLIEQMLANNDASKAADFIKKQHIDPANYPKLVERLQRNCIKYMSKEHPWYKNEEMLLYQQQLLVNFCEYAYQNHMQKEALSIIKRNNLINIIKNPVQKQQMQSDLQNGFEEIPNPLFVKDEFKPVEEFINNEIDAYLNCKDFGYPENQIIFIDKIDENYFDAWKCIHSSNAVGYDCEHVTPWTKLDLDGFKVCFVQIATSSHAFLFDYQKLKDSEEFKNDVRQLLENVGILKIGLSLKDDLKHTVNYLKLKNIKIGSIVELQSCFKVLEGDQKLRSLAYISEFYFKKKLSKFDTCSNWEYRPLRKAQAHYAALDAIISLQIYLSMVGKNNQALENLKQELSLG
ncbi:unnamed protein product (macronuclear) [Paramecium tetraurelia]|uniref:3'-5' exonuclease domain-containing protein n=1 Tax=Paramecium tetraurelia TaxID=5888 RepID=A0BEL7_PARTE|nr:uncharacterized protein GSPATT00028017001 [Paramecium tetraurelia]CAK56984.1 unnamed protein product [Paramecium tetraurelia]|eukprot:XP_001424382.1 hypothetical protein (macronuclear) [Paramecium tetraurelia strain d4-2]